MSRFSAPGHHLGLSVEETKVALDKRKQTLDVINDLKLKRKS